MAQEICSNCGSLNSKGTQKEGGRSIIIFLLLLLCCIIPGLLYWGFKSKTKRTIVCRKCGAVNSLMQVDTPRGQQLFKEFYPAK